MKKILFVSLVIFTMFMSYVVLGGFIQKQQKENSTKPSVAMTSTSSTSGTDTFTTAEVAIHSTSSDCWLIINNKVYDVSKFLGDHPGGAYTIIPYCGKEATNAFDTQDRGRRGGHSDQATQMLADYLIGSIKVS
ncbi:MAG: cytochrome b5-like heme/steroid binding domain-containing protein [Candidatus Saccharimonadales bacterium]